MFTIRTGKLACVALLALLGAACSREQQDWRAAEAADSIEGYDQFIVHHPDSELVTEARTRVAQLGEERDWHEAGTVDSADAYRQFLTQHPNGKWAQEARIRIEGFALDGPAPTATPTSSTTAPATATAPAPAPAARQGSGTALRSPPATSPSRTSAPGSGSASASHSPSQSRVGVQLGAFNTEAGAQKEWQALEGRFGPQLKGLGPHISTIDAASGRLYRLQAVVKDEEHARALCDALKKRGQGCIPALVR